ncbi:hypothetical protein MAR_027581 [Mya arenaria]|uniref:Uncharacterized protein n=1 Tax=Mya arenaria TaxID=6604 RepID=A0ABY7EXG7_MYAAR|nr:hypothetical protein MAR_027581 [Mya arenaria]
MTQHHGHFGCLTCEHPGKVMSQGKGHARVYPPTDFLLRTTQYLIKKARIASTVGPIKGTKGVSTLLGLDWFYIIDGLIFADYMHGVLLGVTKKNFCSSYFQPPIQSSPFHSISHQLYGQKYFDHFVLFVEGIYLLLGDCNSEKQMERAELVLCEFYNSFGKLYGENICTLNLHNACSHLLQYVKLLGPGGHGRVFLSKI